MNGSRAGLTKGVREMKLSTKLLGVTGVAAFLIGGAAQAAPLSSHLLSNGPGPEFEAAQDVSGEFVLRFNEQEETFTAVEGEIQTGDYLAGAIRFDALNASNLGQSGNTGLTGVFLTQVNSVDAISFSGGCPASLTCSTFDFGAASSSAWDAVYGTGGFFDALGGEFGGLDLSNIGGSGLSLADGTSILLFEDQGPEYLGITFPSTVDETVALATEDDYILGVGFDVSDADNTGWAAEGPADVSDFNSSNSGQQLGGFAFSLNVLQNNWSGVEFYRTLNNLSLPTDENVDIIGTEGSLRWTSSNPFAIQDNITVSFDANRIPEPSVLGLFGLGLLGIGGMAARRRKAA